MTLLQERNTHFESYAYIVDNMSIFPSVLTYFQSAFTACLGNYSFLGLAMSYVMPVYWHTLLLLLLS